jgi:hypothetical protein
MSDIDALVREKLPGQRFGVFFNTGEGITLPNGEEVQSGFVVAQDGSHWLYWTGWQDGRVVFAEWQPEQPQSEWADSREYQRALADAQPQLGEGRT